MSRLLTIAARLATLAVPTSAFSAELPRVPEGYTVEVVAEAPLVVHPMMGCFDDRGRLYLAESAGTNRPAKELIDEPLDFIRRLEDTDGDGTFDESTIFADKITFPQGCLWYKGAVYACAPPYVWKFEDADHDGVADKRTVLVESFGFSGNAASIHGPFLGPDERLYWCDGRHGHEFFSETGEIVSKGKAARIFSCKPDGSDVRAFAGGGMDNPVEVDWLDSGEMIGTVNLFYGRPRGDVLVHWVQGGVYPRFDQQDCIDEFTWTGGLLPEIHNYGHVAVSGMCRERAQALGELTTASAGQASAGQASGGRQSPDATDSDSTKTSLTGTTSSDLASQETDAPRSPVASVLVTQFNTHKVVRTTLAREGSTFTALDTEDLIVWDNPDVHPTDVLEAPDGSILVIDTGGWFRIGCPTSQIAKPEIPGAIYRIRRSAVDRIERDEKIATGPFAPGNFHPGPEELRLLLTIGAPEHRLAAAQYIAQQFSDPQAVNKRTPEADAEAMVSALAGGLATGAMDRHLAHELTYALICVDAPQPTRELLRSESANVRRSALIALDQMPDGDLTEAEVIRLLDTNDPDLLEAVLAVISRHEGWVAETVPMFRVWLQEKRENPQRIEVMRTFFLAQVNDLWVQELVADGLAQKKTNPAIRRMLIDVIAQGDVDPLPPLWGQLLDVPLGIYSDPDSRLAAIRTIGARKLDLHDDALLEIAQNPDESPAARGEAFAALAPRMESIPSELFRYVMEQLRQEGDLIVKLTFGRGMAAAALDESQLLMLAESFEAIGPAVVPVLLPAFEKSDRPSVGTALINGLTSLGDAVSLSPAELDQLLSKYPEEVRQQAAPLVARLQADVAEQAARLDELLEVTASGGDASRGKALFFGKTANCSTCHRIGNDGGQVGPALTNIGAIRQPRDLLESIAFPSASFAREFRPYVILTVDGQVQTGIISATTSDSVTLKTTDLKEIRIPRDQIEVMRESDTSIMPKGLDTKLSPGQLSDLLAFLQSLK